MIVVSDTSPITNLAAIDQLDLLRQLYETIVIPEAVYKEMVSVGKTSRSLQISDRQYGIPKSLKYGLLSH